MTTGQYNIMGFMYQLRNCAISQAVIEKSACVVFLHYFIQFSLSCNLSLVCSLQPLLRSAEQYWQRMGTVI